MKRFAFLLAASAFLSTIATAEDSKGKFSFTLYGDFYSVLKHNVSEIDGKAGFWIRRIYLTYDHKVDEKLSAQFRLEAKDPGDFETSSSLEPFVKDAWLRYTDNGYKFTFGLIPTPTTGPAEEKLGYRPIEKTPLDLFKLGSTRDKGLSIQGPLGKGGKADFMVMVGDGSGTKSSDGESRAAYGRIGYLINDKLSADLYADCWDKADDENWHTLKGELFFLNGPVKAGAMMGRQKRSYAMSDDLNLDFFSIYGEYKAGEKCSPFVRLDVFGDPVPDAHKIEFWHMAEDGKPTLLMFGARYRINEAVEVIPSLTCIKYRGIAEGKSSSDKDMIFRLTFSAKL